MYVFGFPFYHFNFKGSINGKKYQIFVAAGNSIIQLKKIDQYWIKHKYWISLHTKHRYEQHWNEWTEGIKWYILVSTKINKDHDDPKYK